MALTAKTVGVRAAEGAVFAALLWLFTDVAPAVLVAVTLGIVGLGVASDLAEDRVGDYAGNVLLGLVVLAGAAAVWLFRASGPLLPALGVLAGAWLVFDGVQHLRHGVDRPDRTKNPRAAFGATKRVANVYGAIDDQPRSRDRLATDLDLDDEAVDDAVDYLERTGRIEENAGTYEVNEDFDRSQSFASSPRRLLERLVEPFRL